MAQVLAELHLDQASLVAAVLYRAVREERVALEEIRKEFGDEVAGLINGVQQMAALADYVQASLMLNYNKRITG